MAGLHCEGCSREWIRKSQTGNLRGFSILIASSTTIEQAEEAIELRESVAMADLLEGTYVRHPMVPRAVSLCNNPHQIGDTFRQTFNGDIFER